MQKSKELLATTFKAIEKQAVKIDNVANGILEAIKMARATTVDKFDALVYSAYDANGWNYKAGRPVAGAEIEKVPQLIRIYVSTVRAAYLVGIDVLGCETFYELRQGIRAKRSLEDAEPAQISADDGMAALGVRIWKPGSLTGQPVHDLAVVYTNLPDDDRELLERSVDRLVKRYAPMIEQRLSA